ncbi:MAG TPA: toxin-antitoxin system HicB family antitoxin [Gemmatimonadaceae bacterium]|nr:toxin-antitoxin system HicB family antitoxin [Gemmatimonadaceae bacterium]
MSTRSIRFPASLDVKLRRAAAHDGVSINQYVSLAVAERLAGETALEALRQRGRRSSRQKFLAALNAVPNAPPMRGDEIATRSKVRERRSTAYLATRHK